MPNTLPGLDVPVVDVKTGLMTQVWYEKFQAIAFGSYADGAAPYTPVLTTVGGGGTIPTFTQTPLTGKYATVGRLAFVSIVARNVSGGTPGVGAQQLQVSLPIPVRKGALSSRPLVGSARDNAEETTVYGLLVAGATVMPLYWQLVSGTKVNQVALACVNFNNADRTLTWQFTYGI